MKAVKVVVKVLVWVVVLVVAAVAALPFWFGPVGKLVANGTVPGIVKTDFRLGHLSLNPYSARFEIGSLNLGNPKGCPVSDAVRVGEVIFDAETLSLMTDVIHIEEVTIRDLFVSVVNDAKGVLNFKQIQANVSGGKDEKKAKSAPAQGRPVQVKNQPVPAQKQESGAEKSAKKVIIDHLEVSGLVVQLSILPIRIPSIVLTDIGRKTGGATLQETWQQILDAVMKSAGVTSDQLKALGVLSGDAMKQANEAVSKATTQATAVVDGATKQVSAQTEKAKAAVDGFTKQLSEIPGSGKASDAAAGAINGSVEAVNDSVKKASDGAKKAMDSLKKLW